MFKTLPVLMLFLSLSGYAQCVIKSSFIDSAGATMSSDTVEGLCVKFKTRGKKLIVKVANRTVDKYEILKVKQTNDYTSLMLFCLTDDLLLTTFRFYKNEIKKETVLVEEYSLFETGSGLNYKIKKRVRGTNRQLPPPYIEPPM